MTQHRLAWLDIDLDAVRNNVQTFRQFLKDEAQEKSQESRTVAKTPYLMAVVKADAYGHGAEQIARAATAAGATWLGVATVDEALRLRAAGIAANILLLSEPPESALPELIEARVTMTVATTDFLQTLAGYAMLEHEEISYHLKVDTGMRRIGVSPDSAIAIARETADMKMLKMDGIFTHFASADVAKDWETAQQLERFQGIIRRLDDIRLRPSIVHCCNTAATLLMPQAHFDMVRVGIGIYGAQPSADTRGTIELTPAMSVRAQAVQVKPVAMGDGVGYGLTWSAHKPMTLVTLPLGYADGIPRLASNKMDVLIDKTGKRIEQVGRVCMDMLMVAADTSDNVKQGDEFVLMGATRAKNNAETVRELANTKALRFGKQEHYISADELAEYAQTITYELFCGFGNRLEKIYRNA